MFIVNFFKFFNSSSDVILFFEHINSSSEVQLEKNDNELILLLLTFNFLINLLLIKISKFSTALLLKSTSSSFSRFTRKEISFNPFELSLRTFSFLR